MQLIQNLNDLRGRAYLYYGRVKPNFLSISV